MALLREKDRQYTTPEDICAHLGDDYEEWMGAVNPPIFQTTLFGRTEKQPQDHFYSRMSNPTVDVAERKIAALEGADGALCFGSGMGAITSAIMYYVKANCHVIMVRSCYCDAREFVTEYLPGKTGLTYTLVSGDDLDEIKAAIQDNTTLIYLESPSSGVFRMQDLESIAKLAKANGIGTVIDNTYSTPLFQNPLKWGIDISVHTVSKYLCGHSNVVGGVICAGKEIIDHIQHHERKLYGSLLAPMDAYLLNMGLRTLPERMRQHSENGRAVAKFLENHPKIQKVFYPGSDTYEQKELFTKYMRGNVGLISFQPKGSADDVRNFMGALKHFIHGVSWGGYESLVAGPGVGKTPEQAAAADIVPNLVRMNIGLENINTIIADLEQALSVLP